jgi:hypothetical protein
MTAPLRLPRSIIPGVASLLCFGLLFSGCMVSFDKPLPGSRMFTANPALLGRWSGKDEHGNRYFIQFDKSRTRDFNVAIIGADYDLGYPNPLFKVTTTRIGAFDYLVVNVPIPEPHTEYMLARYSIDKDKLRIWILSVDKVKEAIKNRQVEGRVVTGSWFTSVIVSSSPADIVQFLKRPQSADLFTLFGEYAKVSP